MKLKKINLKVNQIFALSISILFLGCELEVNNPNSINYDNLNNPVTANALANGTLVEIAQGMGYMIAPYSVATDEVTWVGSRHAWGELDDGNFSDVTNEFVDQAWGPFASARWTADNAVSLIESFEPGSFDINDMARAYLYAALIRIMIGDMFDDFVYSDMTVAGNAIGSANMFQVYDEAIELLNNAENISIDSDLSAKITALRARAKYSKAVWTKVQPPVDTSSPFVDAGGDDASAALSLISDEFNWQMEYSGASTGNDLSWQINGRLELTFPSESTEDALPGGLRTEEFNDTSFVYDTTYVDSLFDTFSIDTTWQDVIDSVAHFTYDTTVVFENQDTTVIEIVVDSSWVTFDTSNVAVYDSTFAGYDTVSNFEVITVSDTLVELSRGVDPRVQTTISNFTDVSGGTDYAALTIVSAKEMYLILAESEISQGNDAEARELLMQLRAIDELETDDELSTENLLKHERQCNLFLQGRRLADMYRFNQQSDHWSDVNDAVTTPGTFFPIPLIEIESNPNIP